MHLDQLPVTKTCHVIVNGKAAEKAMKSDSVYENITCFSNFYNDLAVQYTTITYCSHPSAIAFRMKLRNTLAVHHVNYVIESSDIGGVNLENFEALKSLSMKFEPDSTSQLRACRAGSLVI